MGWVLKALLMLAGSVALFQGFQQVLLEASGAPAAGVPHRFAAVVALSPLPQIGVFAAVALAVACTTAGRGFHVLNFVYLAAVALTAWAWPRSIADFWNSGSSAGLFFFVIIVGLPIFIVSNAGTFLRGFHYLFVPHAASSVVVPPLDRGTSIDTRALGKVLRKEADDSGKRSTSYYKTQSEKARTLKEKLDADAGIAEATIRRERARAALLDAEREVREAKDRAKRT